MSTFDLPNLHSSNRRDLLPAIWAALESACHQWDHPFRCPVLGSIPTRGQGPALRTVILRDAQPDQRHLVFHTDHRSPKVRQIKAHPVVQWLFYDPGSKIQLKAEGRARIYHKDDLAARAWQRTPLPSRAQYATPHAPGKSVSNPSRAASKATTVQECEVGLKQFTVVVCTIREWDYLRLGVEGNRRARFTWTKNRWTSTWVAP